MTPSLVHTGYVAVAHAKFRGWLSRRFSRFTVAGLVVDDAPVLLWQIYVPLSLTTAALGDDAPEDALASGRPIEAWVADVPSRAEGAALQGLREPREPYGESPPGPARALLVSGPAGSGKTTLISSIAAIVARGGESALARRFSRWLPLPLILRDHDLDALDSLDALVARVFAEAKALEPALEVERLYRYLESGEAALMLDGLDEVGSLERRRKVVRWLLGHRWLTGDRQNPGCALIVTARPSGFEGLDDELRLLGALRLHVAPFSWKQVEGFLEKWFALRPITEDERRESTAALIRRLKNEPELSELRRLCRRPAYLTALAFVQGTRGALPHSRVLLFEQIIDAYVDVLDRHRRVLSQHLGERVPFWDHDEKRAVLAEFAWRAQHGAWPEEAPSAAPGEDAGNRPRPLEERRLRWTRAVMAREVEDIIARRAGAWRTLKPGDGAALADYFLQRTGLFAEPQEGTVQFGHLVFQEFLTALYLVERAGAARGKGAYFEKNLLAKVGKPGWFEVARLALALDDRRTAGLGHRVVLPRFDLGRGPIVELACALVLNEEIQWAPWERCVWQLLCLRAGENVRFSKVLRKRMCREAPWLLVSAVDHLADAGNLRETIQAHAFRCPEEEYRKLTEDDTEYIHELFLLERLLPITEYSINHLALLLLRDAGDETIPISAARMIEYRQRLAAATPARGVPCPPLPKLWIAARYFDHLTEIVGAVAVSSRLAWMAADLTGNFLGSVCCRRRVEVPGTHNNLERVRWRVARHEEIRIVYFCATAACAAQLIAANHCHMLFESARRLYHEWVRFFTPMRFHARFLSFAPIKSMTNMVGRNGAEQLFLDESALLVPLVATTTNTEALDTILAAVDGSSSALLYRILVDVSPEKFASLLPTLWAGVWSRYAPTVSVQRAALTSLRARMASPEAMSSDLTDPLDRAAAQAEWAELIDNGASPLPFLDLALSLPWESLEIEPAALERALLDEALRPWRT